MRTEEEYQGLLAALRGDADYHYERLTKAARRAYPDLQEARALERYLRTQEGQAAYEAYAAAPPAPEPVTKHQAQGAGAETLGDLALAALEARAAAEYPKLSKAAAFDRFIQEPEGRQIYEIATCAQADQPAPAAVLAISKGRGVSVAVVLEALKKTLAG